MSHILIVEDDPRLSRGVAYTLETDNHQTAVSATAKEAYAMLASKRFDLLLLDINLPDKSGFEICETVRTSYPDIAIVFLTARDLDEDQGHGFDLGADDYITKPFNMNLLRKRIKAVLNRYALNHPEQYQDGYLSLDFDSLNASAGERTLSLTPTEFRLLRLFIDHPKQVLTRQIILSDIWDREENYVDEHTLTVNINRLRTKLEKDGHPYIKTVYGMGYMWMGGVKDEV